MKEQYCYSMNEESYHGSFDSIEDAKDEAIGCNDLEPGTKYWVGRAEPFLPSIGADNVLEQLSCEACDEVGDAAEDWVTGVTKEQVKQLEDALNEVFKKWMKVTKNEPTFYLVVDSKEYTVPETNGSKG